MKKRKKVKKKVTRRSSSKFPALRPEYNLKSRQEEIADLASYAHKLNEKEKAWLDKFSNEYINASFGKKPLHKTKNQRKECYNRNNARNRCILSKAKACGKTVSFEAMFNDDRSREELDITVEDLIKKSDKE